MKNHELALEYYNALKEISAYQPPEKLRRLAEKQYGLSYEEALEMAYENVLSTARAAISGRRAPKPKLKLKKRESEPPRPESK